ncbi:sodium/potassium-transporting ATPase subunit beta-1-like [Haematobia irritans]|uniref:sodium/potassium-transporting ATPase subunit beta-1-like n=1 Tax=Haematobia irritans TaxID=7368 RepID=UPI003F4FB9E6
MNSINSPFLLRKRYRHQEEFEHQRYPESWHKAIINLETHSYLGRTPKRYLYLLIFYTVFYGILIFLSLICYWIFATTVSEFGPKWYIQQPGFSFEPAIDVSHSGIFKIIYQLDNEEEMNLYVNHIESSLRKYGAIPKEMFQNCSSEMDFGYTKGEPCIFLKINRIVGFKSLTYDHVLEFPENTPSDLLDFVQNLTVDQRNNRIWLSCLSTPNISLQYFPNSFYKTSEVDIEQYIEHEPVEDYIVQYLTDNQRFYSSKDFQRVIAVQLSKVLIDVNYKIICSLWAKNIAREDRGEMSRGIVRLQLQIKA